MTYVILANYTVAKYARNFLLIWQSLYIPLIISVIFWESKRKINCLLHVEVVAAVEVAVGDGFRDVVRGHGILVAIKTRNAKSFPC